MARINGSVSQRQDAYEFYVIWEESDINIADNTSKITATSYIYCKKHSAYNYDDYDHYVTIDGQEFKTTVSEVVLSAGKTVKLATGSKVIRHNDDGSKSITISASSPKLPAGDGWGPASGSASGTATLTTIPRTSGVTCTEGTIGYDTSIIIHRKAESFTHTLKYAFGNLSGTIVEKYPYTTYPWNIPNELYTQIPNDRYGWGTITCETYTEDTLVGTSSCSFKASIDENNCRPTIAANIYDTNGATTALTGNANIMVKYFSNAQVDITATPKNSASITNCSVVAGNKSGSGTNVLLEGVETDTFNLSCTDSRGLPGSNTIIMPFINYIKLAFTNLIVERESSTSSTINVSLKGNYFNGNFVGNNNELTLHVRGKQNGYDWDNWVTLTPNISGNEFTYSGVLGTSFDYQNGFEFEFLANDKLMSVSVVKSVPSGQAIIDIGKNDVRVNGTLNINGELTPATVQFANNTWNNVGDDVAVGDYNAAGLLGLRGRNGKTGIGFHPGDGTGNNGTIQTMIADGYGTMWLSHNFHVNGDVYADGVLRGKAENVESRGTQTAESGGTLPARVGISMQEAYNNGYPATYGNILTMRGAGCNQIFMEWTGHMGGTGGVWYRNLRDYLADGDTWTEWLRLAEVRERNINSMSVTGNVSHIVLGSLMIVWGRAGFTPVANTPTRVDVTFPRAFAEPPGMIVTPNSRVIGTQVLGWGYAGVTTTGCELWVTRTNTDDTNLCWFAIGGV